MKVLWDFWMLVLPVLRDVPPQKGCGVIYPWRDLQTFFLDDIILMWEKAQVDKDSWKNIQPACLAPAMDSQIIGTPQSALHHIIPLECVHFGVPYGTLKMLTFIW